MLIIFVGLYDIWD